MFRIADDRLKSLRLVGGTIVEGVNRDNGEEDSAQESLLQKDETI
jgi:hypothetical protein